MQDPTITTTTSFDRFMNVHIHTELAKEEDDSEEFFEIYFNV